jgi:hypothetical protein
MSYEGHCKACGAINAQEHRRRCDGCGGSILYSEGSTSTVQVNRETSEGFQADRENSRDYCAACTEKVNAALPVWLCCNCGHPKHMHNAACLDRSGVQAGEAGCHCEAFVPPAGTGPDADFGASARGKSA